MTERKTGRKPRPRSNCHIELPYGYRHGEARTYKHGRCHGRQCAEAARAANRDWYARQRAKGSWPTPVGEPEAEARTRRCPHCQAEPGAYCRTKEGDRASRAHASRVDPTKVPRVGPNRPTLSTAERREKERLRKRDYLDRKRKGAGGLCP